jgi:phosphate/sulfate permease
VIEFRDINLEPAALWRSVRSLLLAWVLTLPCAIGFSAFLFFVFRHLF